MSCPLLISSRVLRFLVKVLDVVGVRIIFSLLVRDVFELVLQAFSICVGVSLLVVVGADHAEVLPLDRVDWHVDFVDAFHMQVVKELLLVERLLELFQDEGVTEEVVRGEILV